MFMAVERFFNLHPPKSPPMDPSSYDLNAWQTYYQSQGYDTTTAASYAYYAYQQALATTPTPASYSSTAYTTVANSWDPEAAQQQSAYTPNGPEASTSAEPGKITGKRTTVIRKGGGKMWDECVFSCFLRLWGWV